MATRFSFFDKNNNPVIGAVINLDDSSGDEFLADFINNMPTIAEYISKNKNVSGRNNGWYDFKNRDIPQEWLDDPEKYSAQISLYHNRGMCLSVFGSNVIGTARDAGNLAAGYLSGRSGIPFVLTRFAFDVYQKGIEPPVSRLAQNYGYWMGYYVYIKNTSNIYAK